MGRLYKIWAKVFHPTGIILICFREPFLSAISVTQYASIPNKRTLRSPTHHQKETITKVLAHPGGHYAFYKVRNSKEIKKKKKV